MSRMRTRTIWFVLSASILACTPSCGGNAKEFAFREWISTRPQYAQQLADSRLASFLQKSPALAADVYDTVGTKGDNFQSINNDNIKFRYMLHKAKRGKNRNKLLVYCHGAGSTHESWLWPSKLIGGSESLFRLQELFGQDSPNVLVLSFGKFWMLTPGPRPSALETDNGSKQRRLVEKHERNITRANAKIRELRTELEQERRDAAVLENQANTSRPQIDELKNRLASIPPDTSRSSSRSARGLQRELRRANNDIRNAKKDVERYTRRYEEEKRDNDTRGMKRQKRRLDGANMKLAEAQSRKEQLERELREAPAPISESSDNSRRQLERRIRDLERDLGRVQRRHQRADRNMDRLAKRLEVAQKKKNELESEHAKDLGELEVDTDLLLYATVNNFYEIIDWVAQAHGLGQDMQRIVFGISQGGFNAIQLFFAKPEYWQKGVFASSLILDCYPLTPNDPEYISYFRNRDSDKNVCSFDDYLSSPHTETKFVPVLVKKNFPTFSDWRGADPLRLAERVTSAMRMHICWDSNDKFSFDKGNERFHNIAKTKSNSVTHDIHNRGHSWYNADKVNNFINAQ